MASTPRRWRWRPGRWYEVGATEYGGPGRPELRATTGRFPTPPSPTFRPTPTRSPSSPCWTATLPTAGAFTFADADALDRLPYLTALRVTRDGRTELLYKRDIGYGQGPGQLIENGQPYRLDLWWQAAQTLGVSKSAVRIAARPRHRRRRDARGAAQKPPKRQRGRRRHELPARRSRRRASRWRSTPGARTRILAERPRGRRRRSARRGEGDGRRRQPPVRQRVPVRRRTRQLARHPAARL